MQESIYQAISNGQALPQLQTAQFADPSAFIRSLDIFNNTPLTVLLTLNGMAILVNAYRREILNVEPCKNVTVNYAGSATSSGFIHILYSDENMVPGSFNLGSSTQEGVIATVSTIVSVPSSSSGWAAESLFVATVANAPSALAGTNTVAKRISLVHFSLSNYPAAESTYWQIIPLGPGGIEAYNIFTHSEASLDTDFAFPYPLYDVKPTDTPASQVQIGFWVANTPSGGPFPVPITAEFLLT